MGPVKRFFLFTKEKINVSLIIYNVYLLIATLLIFFLGFSSIVNISKVCTPNVVNVLNIGLGICCWRVVKKVASVCDQHTIESHFIGRGELPIVVILVNFMITVNPFIGIYSYWANVIITGVMGYAVSNLLVLLVEQLSETRSPMNYTLLKTTKATYSQKVFMAIFFAITEAYYIGLCCLDISSLPNFCVMIAFQHAIPACPWINILAIPIVYRAFLACNSHELGFSGKEPISGRKWSGVCRWNVETRQWDYVETPEKAVVVIA